MEFQWYPGHMTKAKREMKDELKLIDVIIELVDARIPYSSKNPDINGFADGKSRILLMNKYDLADDGVTKQWTGYYEGQGYLVECINSKTGKGVKTVNGLIQQACREKIERNRRRGILNRPMRAMVAGIPNVGKSTFINSFAGKACTKTGNKPGVTKGKQWIRLNAQVELLDTPGILWPKFDDKNVGLHLAYIGSIKDELYNMFELGMLLTGYIMETYPDILSEFYQIETEEKAEDYLENIARRRGFLKTGGELDFDKAAKCLVDDYRLGRLGKVSLETPKDIVV